MKAFAQSVLSCAVLIGLAAMAAAQQGEAEPQSSASNEVPALKLPRISSAGGGFVVKVTAGWEFDVLEEITVTELGVWDRDGAGLDVEIPVGLWDPDGKLIVSTVVPKGDKSGAVENFRYIKIDPKKLAVGGPYVVAAQYSPGSKEMVISANQGEFATSGAVRWRKARRSTGGELGLPADTKEPFNEMPGGFGPGFLITTATKRPDLYYRVREIFPAGTHKTFATPVGADGMPPAVEQPVISAFASPDGELRQIVFNDMPLGKGEEALRKLTDEVKRRYPADKADRPLVFLAAMSSVQEEDVKAIGKAIGELYDDRHARNESGQGSFGQLRPRQAAIAGKFVAPERFLDKGEYIEDRWTDLLWQKDGAAAGKKNFAEANDYATELELGKLTDWRLPLAEELVTIFPADFAPFLNSKYNDGECCKGPAEFASFWTSQLDVRSRDYAFVYHWYSRGGANNCFARRNYVYVRCVHDPVR